MRARSHPRDKSASTNTGAVPLPLCGVGMCGSCCGRSSQNQQRPFRLRLAHGLQKQLVAYAAGQRPLHSTYLVVQVGDLCDRSEKELLAEKARLNEAGLSLEIEFVDARKESSASIRWAASPREINEICTACGFQFALGRARRSSGQQAASGIGSEDEIHSGW